MKTLKKLVVFSVAALFMLTILPLTGQNLISYDSRRQERLREFSEKMSRQWQKNRAEAEQRARKEEIPVRKVFEDGTVIELQRYWNDIPLYYTTLNMGAAETIAADKVWQGGGADLELSGSTEALGIWDEGNVRTTHQEFENRVTWKDVPSSLNDHATHVAGTMIAAGVNPNARGMSYEAELYAYEWNEDLADMAIEAGDGMRVSNHSYGYVTGWLWNYHGDDKWAWFGNTDISEEEDYVFGYYSSISADWDELIYNAGDYLPVPAAGNDRGRGPTTQPVEHWVRENGGWALSETERQIDGGDDGYDCLSHFTLAKNVLSVGAIEEISGGYSDSSDINMANFSAWGPADDGRIKPDVVAKGIGTYSTSSGGDDHYTIKTGTSMAAPSVAGSIGLLQEHYRKEISESAPLASTIKALIIHTVDKTGINKGPDYEHGWGLINIEQAAQVISDQREGINIDNSHIFEINLASGDDYSLDVESEGDEPLKVTISWTDPPAIPVDNPNLPPSERQNPLNNTTPMLINDLDLRIYGPDGKEYKPWILDLESPSDPATTGDNYRDNVEQVYIEEPQEGQYTIEVTHKDSLVNESQDFSLIITGQAVYTDVQGWMDYYE